MPFSSNPVYVGNGDIVRVRYPTPSTWNTSVSVDVQIGTGFDEVGGDGNGITFSTKIPDGKIDAISFTNQLGYLSQYNATTETLGTSYTDFEKFTTYYSNVVEIDNIEIPVPACIRAIANGPKNSSTLQTGSTFQPQFCIFRNGSAVSPGWRTSVTANLAAPGNTGLQPGDKVQLRVKTPNWYITTLAVDFSVGEESYDGGWPSAFVTAGLNNNSRVRATWNFTTRPQDQDILFSELEFTDRVDQVPTNNGGSTYFYKKVDITNIDDDVVLRVSRTGDTRMVKVEGGGGSNPPTSGYSTSLNGVVLGDDVWVRLPNGSDFTQKESGTVKIYATGGQTYTRGSNTYENVSAGSYGSGTYQETQVLGNQEDGWQSWTEVDRYPNDIQADRIFTYGVKTDIIDVGAGFNYTQTFNTTGGSGSGMKIRMGAGGSGSAFVNVDKRNTVFIQDPGYGYQIGDEVTIISPSGSSADNAKIEIQEYEVVYVSNGTTAECEPGLMYFTDIPVSGLGTEFSSGAYNDLETPLTNYGRSGETNGIATTQSYVATLNGQTVKIKAIINGTVGQIRKNNTGAWSTVSVTVQNGDVINLKTNSSLTWGASGSQAVTSSIKIQGPPFGNPDVGNPTNGPAKLFPDEVTTMTLNTRSKRVVPFPFHARPVFLAEGSVEYIAKVPIQGLDVQTNATTSTAGADLSVDQSNWGNNIVIQPTSEYLYIRKTAASGSGAITQTTYTVGIGSDTVSDTFIIYNRQTNSEGDFGSIIINGQSQLVSQTIPYYALEDFTVTLIGAGGGTGGDDAPNSFGAGGGAGNLLRVRVQKSLSDFPLQSDGITPSGALNFYAPTKGEEGGAFGEGAPSNATGGYGQGGAGGFGYANGGDGGNAGFEDFSGAGGGGGGAAAVTMADGTLIAMAGGGGGGAGGGNDTVPPLPGSKQFGNSIVYHGTVKSSTSGLNTAGDDGSDGGNWNPTIVGCSIVGSGDGPYGNPGTGELGGFITDDNTSLLFMGKYNPVLVTERTATWNSNTTGVAKLRIRAIAGNDSNGGERPNGSNEKLTLEIGSGTPRVVTVIPDYPSIGNPTFDSQYGAWQNYDVPLNAGEKISSLQLKFKSTAGSPEFNASVPASVQSDNLNANDAYAIDYIQFLNASDTIVATLKPGPSQGGGGGGGGGGFDGNAGIIAPNPDIFDNRDLDAYGGGHGGAYADTVGGTTVILSNFAGLGAAPGQDGVVYVEYPPQDVTPDLYSFDTVEGLDANETVLSNRALITSITGGVPINVVAPGFNVKARVCDTLSGNDCGDWGATQITNNKYLQLEGTTGTEYTKTYTVKVDVGETPGEWVLKTGPKPDRTPDFYNFATVDPCDLNSLIVSETEVISGINVPVTVSVDQSAEFRVRTVGQSWSAWYAGDSGQKISNGQELQLRGTSSTTFITTTTFNIVVGIGASSTSQWSIKTKSQQDTEPNSFTWIDSLNNDLNEDVWSNSNFIDGIETTVKFQVTPNVGDAPSNSATAELPTIYVDGVAQLDSNGDPEDIIDVNPDALVRLFYKTTNVIGEQRHFDTRVGAQVVAGLVEGLGVYPVYTTDWRVGIAGSFTANPVEFTFATKLATGPNVDTEADETVTVSGLGGSISLPLITTNGLEVRKNNTGSWAPSTIGTPTNVQNGETFQVRITSSVIPGFSSTGQITLGNYTTSFTVQTPAPIQDPILSQWYSSIQPVKYIVAGPNVGKQVRFDTKFDGLPIGSIIPILQDATQSDNWGDLEGSVVSRFPSFLYCDGSYVDPESYPLLYAAIQNKYGEKAEGGTFTIEIRDFKGNILKAIGDAKTSFRLPDFRNRYVKGTGVIDGNQLSSSSLVPTFNPTKQAGSPGNGQPGATGGRWFIDTIGDPGVAELEQVDTPAEGLPPTESDYFGIASVSTTGYNDVGGLIEFQVIGDTICKVGLKKEKIYDTPLHFHDLITGEPDPVAVKGRVTWGQNGGWKVPFETSGNNPVGDDSGPTAIAKQGFWNAWGYMYWNNSAPRPTVPSSYLPKSAYCPGEDTVWWSGDEDNNEMWTQPSGYIGVNSIEETPDPKWIQDELDSGADFNEINSYINVTGSPWQGGETSSLLGVDPAYKWFSAIDIPSKIATIKGFVPLQKLAHDHYLSLLEPFDNGPSGAMYSFGNFDSAGNQSDGLAAASQEYKQNVVDLPFNSITDLGVQVLPGQFTLSATKQLVPTPSLAPQDQVSLVSPYLWTKWVIKAY